GGARGRWRVVRTNDPVLALKSHRQLAIKHTRDWTQAVLIREILSILKSKPLLGRAQVATEEATLPFLRGWWGPRCRVDVRINADLTHLACGHPKHGDVETVV